MNTYKMQRGYENLQKGIYQGVGRYGIPEIKPVESVCDNWIGFNSVKSLKDPGQSGVHFFLDDYQFNRVWTHPDAYTDMLKKFKAVCTPQFSTYTDFPLAVQIYNHYRKHWLGAYWQELGITVIPTIGWSDYDSYKWCFDGEPKGGCVAVSSVGTQVNIDSRILFSDGYGEMLERLRPSRVYFYGKIPCECAEYSQGIEVINIMPYHQKFRALGGNGSQSGFLGVSGVDKSSIEFAPDLKTAIGDMKKPFTITNCRNNSNPYKGEDNCVHCVVTYELRRRGYDVIALPSYSAEKWQEVNIGGYSSADRWRGAFRGAKTVSIGGKSSSEVLLNLDSQMKEYGSGSRATVRIYVPSIREYHVFNVENNNNRINYVDVEVGAKYNKVEMVEMFDNAPNYDVTLTRTDNLRLSDRARFFVKQRKND